MLSIIYIIFALYLLTNTRRLNICSCIIIASTAKKWICNMFTQIYAESKCVVSARSTNLEKMYTKLVILQRYQKRSKCKVKVVFTSLLRANTMQVTNFQISHVLTFSTKLSQIQSPKFASYLLQVQICLNPFFRPVY